MSTPLIFGLGLSLVVVAAFGLIALSRAPSKVSRRQKARRVPPSAATAEDAGFGGEATAVIQRRDVDGTQQAPSKIDAPRSQQITGRHRVVQLPTPIEAAKADTDTDQLRFEVRTDLEVASPKETACLKALLKDPEDPDPALELSGLLQQREHPQGDAIVAQWARLSATTDEEFHHAAWAEAEVMARVASRLVETLDPQDPDLALVWRQGFIQHAQIGCGDAAIDDEKALTLFARICRSPAALLMTDLVIRLQHRDSAEALVAHTLPPGLRRLSIICAQQEAWGRVEASSSMVNARWGTMHTHAASPGFDGKALVAACATDRADVLAIDLRRAAIVFSTPAGEPGCPPPCFRVAGERATELFQLGAPPAAQLDGILAALRPIGCQPLCQLQHTEPHYETRPIEAAAHRVIAAGARASVVQQLLSAGALLVTRDIAFGPGRQGGFLAIFEERALFVSPRTG